MAFIERYVLVQGLIGGALALAFLGAVHYVSHDDSPPKFSSECVSEGVMVIKSSKTEYFDVFYSEGCIK